MDERAEHDKSIFDAFVSGGSEYRSEKRLKMKEALGPKKPEGQAESEERELNTEDLKQKQLNAYFEEYDSVHRPKSLLEMHQEKKKQSSNLGHLEFDSNSLFAPRIDSKKVFSIVGSAQNDLSRKFSSGKFKNSFL